MLDLICDFRSGEKLEIVIPALNEQERLTLFKKYYSDLFDLVVLDGGSNDLTIEWMKNNQITIYRRIVDGPAENHFVYYSNNLSKSNITFLAFADEFVNKEELVSCAAFLKSNSNSVILCKKYEWAFGSHNNLSKNQKTYSPRGFSKGVVQYDPSFLHASLHYRRENNVKIAYCFLNHFHLWSVQSSFGKAGIYANMEVEQFFKNPNSIKRFFKRFMYEELIKLPKRLWQERNRGPAFLLWMIFVSFAVASVGIVSLIEFMYFPNIQKQKELYAKYFEA